MHTQGQHYGVTKRLIYDHTDRIQESPLVNCSDLMGKDE